VSENFFLFYFWEIKKGSLGFLLFFFGVDVFKREQMKRYKTIKPLGDGTYGSVAKAVNLETNEIVENLKDHSCLIFYRSLSRK
jgi:hypothetical protein